VIESGVRGTLTALAPTAILPVDRPTSTQVPTLPPSTQAPASTPTQLPADQTTLLVAPPTASQPAPAPTDTLSPVSADTGELIFQDTFDTSGPWAVGETEDSNVSVSGGVLLFTHKTPGSFSFRLVGKQSQDFHAEVTTALAKQCASGDRYGLMFRVLDPSNYYAFVIECDGQYRFLRYVSGAATPIVDWTATPAIERGAQSINTLAVTARGDTFEFSVNGTLLSTASDGIFASGRFGLLVGANATKDFTVVFDNLTVNKMP
jgi:hypothetical protein